MVLENFRLQDKDNYKSNAIFLTLSIASAWTSVILTGRKLSESSRHSTTGLSKLRRVSFLKNTQKTLS